MTEASMPRTVLFGGFATFVDGKSSGAGDLSDPGQLSIALPGTQAASFHTFFEEETDSTTFKHDARLHDLEQRKLSDLADVPVPQRLQSDQEQAFAAPAALGSGAEDHVDHAGDIGLQVSVTSPRPRASSDRNPQAATEFGFQHLSTEQRKNAASQAFDGAESAPAKPLASSALPPTNKSVLSQSPEIPLDKSHATTTAEVHHHPVGGFRNGGVNDIDILPRDDGIAFQDWLTAPTPGAQSKAENPAQALGSRDAPAPPSMRGDAVPLTSREEGVADTLPKPDKPVSMSDIPNRALQTVPGDTRPKIDPAPRTDQRADLLLRNTQSQVAPKRSEATASFASSAIRSTSDAAPEGVHPRNLLSLDMPVSKSGGETKDVPASPSPPSRTALDKSNVSAVVVQAAQGVIPVTPRVAESYFSERIFSLDVPAELSVGAPQAGASSVQALSSLTVAPDLARQVAQQVSHLHVRMDTGPVEIQLNPEELGRVRISMTMGEGTITMNIQAERPETLELLRRNIDQLTQEFRQIGYGNISFSFDQSSQGREEGKGHAGDPEEPSAQALNENPPPPRRQVESGTVLDMRV